MGILEDKVVMITGASRGIGRAIAEECAAEGAALALCDLKKDWLSETADNVAKHGARCETFEMDVAHSDAVKKAVKSVNDTFGRIDVAVNNAGIARDGLMLRMTDDDWDSVIRVNLTGAFMVTRAVSRLMLKQRSGAIVNIASIIGLIGNAGQCNYSASKAGVIALTKSSAKELAARNVRVNAVAPGFIETKMTDELPEEYKEGIRSQIALKRFGVPREVARAVVFLAGEDSSYITGQVLTVSGGMVM